MLTHQTAKHGCAPTIKQLRKPDAIDLTNEQWRFLKQMVASCVQQDEACRQCFETVNDYWRHLRQLLEEQRGRCALSGIRLRTNAEADRSPDAIDPLKGHVPGNLRLVCRFLNPIDHSKRKTVDDSFDGPAQWTRSLVAEYYFGGQGGLLC